MTPIEAEDVVQETVITVARNLPGFHYDPAKCSFKTWLFNVTLWRIRDQWRKRHPVETPLPGQPGDTDRTRTIERIPGPEAEQPIALWENEWKRDLLEQALERVKVQVAEKPFQIFDLYAHQGWPAREVARNLGVSLASVYVTKHRIARLLAKEIRQLKRRTESIESVR